MACVAQPMNQECFRWPVITEETIAKIADLLRSGRIHRNPELTEGFESDLCRFFRVDHALLVCNGTAAAFSAYHALGLVNGDEIIAPAFTHWATVVPATLLGCRAAFADVEPDSFSLSLESTERLITPKTRAVVVSHMYGNPADVARLRALCDRHGLFLIEDLSHAPGACVNGAPVGSFGDAAFFSMQATKTVCGGEGGVLLTRDPRIYARAVELGHPKRISRLPVEFKRYDRVGLGYKFTLSPILALLAWESFKQLEAVNEVRIAMFHRFRSSIAGISQVMFPAEHDGVRRVYWEYEMFVRPPGRAPSEIAAALMERGVVADVPRFEFLPDLPHFAHDRVAPDSFPNARRLREETLVLRPFSRRDDGALAAYVRAFQEALSPG
jgi:perosamine synthetase